MHGPPLLEVTLSQPFSCLPGETIFPRMRAAAIRQLFLDYFTSPPRNHRLVPSSPLVPADDPSLLFTNAGMVQFKRELQGLERLDKKRAVTCKKCVRDVGSKNLKEAVEG